MTAQTPRRRPSIDWRGLGLTTEPATWPHPSDYYGDDEGCARIGAHYAGSLPLDHLQQDERDWLCREIRERQQQALANARAYFAGRVPRRYADVQPDQRTAPWVRQVTADPHAAPSLLIVGPTGTGKTHLAWATIRALAETGSHISNRWRAITAVDMYATLRPSGSTTPDAEMRSLSSMPLLFIDDLAAAKATEWTEEITYRLVNHRYEQCLPTVITSNVQPAGMRDVLGERVASRLTEMCERVVLRGEDLRKGRTA